MVRLFDNTLRDGGNVVGHGFPISLTQSIIGALLTVVLILAVLMLIVCAIMWAIGSANGHHQVATKARIGVWTALGAAALAGAGVAWMNWLITIGGQL